jgi:hypothetical protein
MRTPGYIYLCLISLLAMALHGLVAVWLFRLNSPSETLIFASILFLWSLAPYGLCFLIAKAFHKVAPPAVAATIVLLIDAAANIDIARSKSSTAALGYMFMPLWNLILTVPVITLAGHLLIRLRSRNQYVP